MLTSRGWWFFLTVLVVLVMSLWTNTTGVSLIALTLQLWFLANWLLFQLRLLAIQGRLRVVRQLADEQGPVQSLWAGRTFHVRVRLCNDGVLGLPYARVQERVPFGVQRIAGAAHVEGPVSQLQKHKQILLLLLILYSFSSTTGTAFNGMPIFNFTRA